MKNIRTISKIAMLSVVIGIISSSSLLAFSLASDNTEKNISKEEIAAEKLANSLVLNEELGELKQQLEDEGLLAVNNVVNVKILNEYDEVLYEGSYNGINAEDKVLKKYMEKADLVMSTGDVAYYMVF